MPSNLYLFLAVFLAGFSSGLLVYARYLDQPCPPCEKLSIQKIKAQKGSKQCFDFLLEAGGERTSKP